MYGPFSAAYPGNSVGAVVDYVTRMPTQFEAHAKVGYAQQPFELYSTETFRAWQASASVGNRQRRLRLVAQLQPHRQRRPAADLRRHGWSAPARPAARARRSPAPSATATTRTALATSWARHPVPHAAGPRQGSSSPTTSRRRCARPTRWAAGRTTSDGRRRVAICAMRQATPCLQRRRSTSTAAVHASLPTATSRCTRERFTHFMHGLSRQEPHARAYGTGRSRPACTTTRKDSAARADVRCRARNGGAGTHRRPARHRLEHAGAEGHLAAAGPDGAHIVDFGVQHDATSCARGLDTPGNWEDGAAGAGQRRRRQDARCTASGRRTPGLRAGVEDRAGRCARALATPTTAPRHRRLAAAGLARAQRELPLAEGGAVLAWRRDTGAQGLRRPGGAHADRERALRRDLHGQRACHQRPEPEAREVLDHRTTRREGLRQPVRAARDLFTRTPQDALYSQTDVRPPPPQRQPVQNVDRIRTSGLEVAVRAATCSSRVSTWGQRDLRRLDDRGERGLVPGRPSASGSRTCRAGAPRLLASYRLTSAGPARIGARYSGPQYRTLDNTDINGYTYQGVSSFFAADLRVRYQSTAKDRPRSASTTSTTTSTGTSTPIRSAAITPS